MARRIHADKDAPTRRRSIVSTLLRAGRVAEPTPERSEPHSAPPFRGSMQIRHVDCGSCNGCEIEANSIFGPVYDAARYGLGHVASPRHADALMVTGPVTKNMTVPLRKTLDAVAEPRVVIAMGDCAIDGGEFAGGYGVEGAVSDVVEVDLEIPGCPPHPDEVIRALRGLIDR